MSLESSIKEYEFKIKLKDEIANFQQILSEKLPFAIPNFLDRLSTLEIVFTKNIEGIYDVKYYTIQDLNRLIVDIPLSLAVIKYEITPEFRERLYYELLVMSSTYISESKSVNGFAVSKVYARDYGVILNKGYTELLTKRFFKCTNKKPQDNRDKKYYNRAMAIATKVEQFIGKEEMERAFFAGDSEYIIERFNNEGLDGKLFMENMFGFRILEDTEFFKEELDKIPDPKKNKVKTKRLNKQ